LYAFCLFHILNKTAFELSVRANPVTNETYISLFVRLALIGRLKECI